MRSSNPLKSAKQQGKVTGSLDREILGKNLTSCPVAIGPGQEPISAIARTNVQGKVGPKSGNIPERKDY